MDRYVVAGNPVQHSRSPFIHAAFARQTGEALVYDRLLCPLDGFAATIRAFAASRDGGPARGCNVTVPFKFEAFALAPRRTPRAQLAGAANVLRFDAAEHGGWLADNTDGVGLVRDLAGNAGVRLDGARVLVVGAGGGAAGALGALIDAGPAEIVVANRTADRARGLVERHRAAADAAPRPLRLAAAGLDDCGRGYDVVVNATATSLAAGGPPVGPGVLAPGALALDMMYGAPARPFVAWAEAHGARGRDGLGMLVEQAAEAFFVWRGVRPRTADVLAELRARVDAGLP